MATTTSEQEMESSGVEGEPEARVGLSYTFSQLRKDPTAMAGLVLVGFMTLVATVAFVDSTVFKWFGMQYAIAESVWYNPVNSDVNPIPFERPRSSATSVRSPSVSRR